MKTVVSQLVYIVSVSVLVVTIEKQKSLAISTRRRTKVDKKLKNITLWIKDWLWSLATNTGLVLGEMWTIIRGEWY